MTTPAQRRPVMSACGWSFAPPCKGQNLIETPIELEDLDPHISRTALGAILRQTAKSGVAEGKVPAVPCAEPLQQARRTWRIDRINIVFQRYDGFAAAGIPLSRAPSEQLPVHSPR